MIFRSAIFIIETIPAYETSSALQFAHMMFHSMHTFILLTIIGVFGTGYFPRNFLSTEIYYDLLSAIPIMPMFVITDLLQQRFLPPGTERYIDCPAGCVISVICGVIGFLQIFALYYLLGKKINALLRKIPDSICLFLFLGSFAGFIIKQVLLLKTNTYYMDNPVTLHYVSTVSFTFNCALILASSLIIILLSFTALQSRRLQYVQSLENSMLLSYYTNIAALHSSIRGMRHDLSNHLAAFSFIASGESAAGPGRQALMSTSGGSGMPGVLSALSASELSSDFGTPGTSAVPGAARAPGVSDRAEASGDFSPAEPGGCTPPDISGRCAEASLHASCGTGALRAPEDPGRCAPGIPGDANRLSTLSSSTASTITADLPGNSKPSNSAAIKLSNMSSMPDLPSDSIPLADPNNTIASIAAGMPGDSIAPGSPAPAVSSDPRESYRRSLLEVCNEIDRQITAQTAWQQIDTDTLSSREKYEIYHYVTTAMQKHRIPASALCIKTKTGDESLEITLRIDATNTPRSKALHLPLLRHGTMFRLIKLIAQSHGGDAAWRKAEDGYALVVRISAHPNTKNASLHCNIW